MIKHNKCYPVQNVLRLERVTAYAINELHVAMSETRYHRYIHQTAYMQDIRIYKSKRSPANTIFLLLIQSIAVLFIFFILRRVRQMRGTVDDGIKVMKNNDLVMQR